MLDPLTAQERIAIAAGCQLALHWQFKSDRVSLCGVLEQALPHLRRDSDFTAFAHAARDVIGADTPVKWTATTARLAMALGPLLRRDMAVAISRLRDAEIAAGGAT